MTDTDPRNIPPALQTHAERKASAAQQPLYRLADGVDLYGTAAQCGSFFGALAAAKGELPPIPKNRTVSIRLASGQSYSFDYAPMETILPIVEPVLSRHGLAVLQPPARPQDNAPITITTIIGHKDGAILVSAWSLPPAKSMKDAGSELTYGARYSLSKALCLAAGDPDADDLPDGSRGESSAQSADRSRPGARTAERFRPERSVEEEAEQAKLDAEIRSQRKYIDMSGQQLAEFVGWAIGPEISVRDVVGNLALTRKLHAALHNNDLLMRFQSRIPQDVPGTDEEPKP